MRTLNLILLVGLFLLLGCSNSTKEKQDMKNEEWFVSAKYTESCNCDIPCPCNFGGSSTNGFCHVNGLIEIEKGHYKGTDLSGVTFMYTESMGKWLKYYAEENTTDEQLNAIQVLLPIIFEYDFEPNVLASERVPIKIERNETVTKYSVPGSYAEVAMLKGLNGEPVRLNNLPFRYTFEYIQYKTLKSEHKSENENFGHSGTHAFVGRVDASSNNY
ncbi:MAG: DUF1326 domain-containing protein [Ignavibacterium sp.]|nr:MAG: DUF1326 domain-containing protein [Ignavibacterium sp.]